METSLYQQARTIIQTLDGVATAAQATVARQACGDDRALLEIVESLIAQDETDALIEPVSSGVRVRSGEVIEKYVVEERLGVGGMAEVWAVRHKLLGSRYALKVLIFAMPALRKRLLEEGRAQARLRHPNIVPVWDVLDVSGVPGLLMPLVDGPSLRRLLSEGPLSVPAAVEVFQNIVAGVTYAHQNGFIHRDLKPANILLDVEQNRLLPRVADFGLVKTARPANAAAYDGPGLFMGTIAYASPEQLLNAANVTTATDLFSLGVILVEMITGRLPFSAKSLAEARISHSGAPDLSGMPDELVVLAQALLQPEPARRPKGEAILEALSVLTRLTDVGQQNLLNRARPQRSVETALTSILGKTNHNLPARRDPFVGRQEELEQLRTLVNSNARLVTLTGPGGVGKTRLAVELCRQECAVWSGGVWFCDLTDARDQGAVIAALAAVLEVPPGVNQRQFLQDALLLRGRCILLLDNLEQVAQDAAALIDGWLNAAPEVVFLNTSRVPLRLRGERRFSLAPMGAEEGRALFVSRAKMANPDFELRPTNRDAVQELVEMLDGLPLAIELAAARARMATPSGLLARLSKRFRLLSGRAPDRSAHQQTLKATLQWSWDLLHPTEQAALAQCSVFEGGFTIEAAEEILDLSDHDPDVWVEEVLAELVDQSLLACEPGVRPRMSLLVSVQAFAAEQLSDPQVVARHGAHFAQMGADVALEAALQDPDAARAFALERANLLVGARRAIAQGAADVAVGCAQAAAAILMRQGPFDEGIALMEELERSLSLSTGQAVEIMAAHGNLLSVAGQLSVGIDRLRTAAATKGLSPLRQARLQADLASWLGQNGDYDEAQTLLEAALTAARAARSRRLEARTLRYLGLVQASLGRLDPAEDSFRQALRIARQIGDRLREGRTLGNLGHLLMERGRHEEAVTLLQETLRLTRDMRDHLSAAGWLELLGAIAVRSGQLDTARAHYEEALSLNRRTGRRRGEGLVLRGLAVIAKRQNDLDASVLRYAEAISVAQAIHDKRMECGLLNNLSEVFLDMGQLPQAQETCTHAITIARDIGQRGSEAFGIGTLGRIAEARGDVSAALENYTQAVELTEAISDRWKQGIWSWRLGALLVTTGQTERAHAALATAETLLQERGDRWRLAQVWCARVALAVAEGDTETARAALRQAETLGEALKPGTNTELHGALARARDLLR